MNSRSYPALLIVTAYGIGLTRAERWSSLHQLFSALVDQQHREPVRVVDCLFSWSWKGTENDAWKHIEGMDRLKTPLSDYLYQLFNNWRKSFVALTHDFELVFERFELLGAVAHSERYTKEQLSQALSGDPRRASAWMPVGRLGWHTAHRDKLVPELQADPMRGKLINAKFARSDPEFLELSLNIFMRMAQRISWS
jgi:hypothetical protein